MSITITALAEHITITGCVETRLTVPMPADVDEDARYRLALSDGTMIDGILDDDGKTHFSVAVEGAGHTRIRGSMITHDWLVDWVALAEPDQSAFRMPEDTDLPLFPSLVDRHEMNLGDRIEQVAKKLEAATPEPVNTRH